MTEIVENVDFSCVLHFGFVDKLYENQMFEELNKIFNVKEPQTIYSASGLGISHNNTNYKLYINEEVPDFDSVITIVRHVVDKIVDVITVATLSNETNNKIIRDEKNITEITKYVSDLFDDLPTLKDRTEIYEPTISYMRPNEYVCVYNDEGEFQESICEEWINKNNSFFRKFGFSDYSLISVLLSKELKVYENIMSHGTSSSWGKMAIINTGQFNKIYLQDNGISHFNITFFLNELDILIKIYRGYEWACNRLKKVNEIDGNSYQLLSKDFSKLKTKKFMKEYYSFEKEKIEWTKLSNKITDELNELEKVTPYFRNKEKSYNIGEYDIPVVLNHGLRLVGKSNSVLVLYSEELNYYYNRLKSDIDRITEKHKGITNFFHDKINIESIRLTNKHTRLMTIMTIVILIATLVSILDLSKVKDAIIEYMKLFNFA